MEQTAKRGSFWTTLPGILTGCAAIITAVGGLIGALYAAGMIAAGNGASPGVAATATPYRYLQVVYPNGGEVWQREVPYTIRWNSQGINEDVKILLKGGTGSGGWFVVTERTPNTGSFTYVLPAEVPNGSYL